MVYESGRCARIKFLGRVQSPAKIVSFWGKFSRARCCVYSDCYVERWKARRGIFFCSRRWTWRKRVRGLINFLVLEWYLHPFMMEVLEVGSGEMRDVITVDELSEGLLAAILGQICPRRIGCSGLARWFTLVQRHRTAHEW